MRDADWAEVMLSVSPEAGRAVQLDVTRARAELSRVSADLGYWNARYAETVERRMRAKAERERLFGELLVDPAFVEHVSLRIGKQPNLDQLKGAITNDERYQDAQEAEARAEGDKWRARGMADAIVAKKEMTSTLGRLIASDFSERDGPLDDPADDFDHKEDQG